MRKKLTRPGKPVTVALGLVLLGLLLVGAKERLSVSTSDHLIQSLDCGEQVQASGAAVHCSATLSDDTFPRRSWSAPGGTPESGIGAAASSVTCSPEPEHVCGGGASAGFTTVFAEQGKKTITLTVCSGSECSSATAIVVIEPARTSASKLTATLAYS